MKILVTGGAGYIGSATVKDLVERDYEVVVVDNLSRGSIRLVNKKAKFYEVDLVDKEKLNKVFKENKIDSVIHFAAYKTVEESMENAIKYSDNIIGTINLLNLMAEYNVKRIVYSSTALVYGIPKYTPIDENHSTNPVSYYGFTKLECEKIIEWYFKVYGINYLCLRYFNVAGDCGLKYIDTSPRNIFPIIMETLFGKRTKLTIFGSDYNTRDKTCIRDYIDINDLVRAHILALNINENGVINLGTSKGVSVKELVDHTIKITGKKFNYEFGARRKGDVDMLVAANKKAKDVLGWKPEKGIKEMIKSTYEVYYEKYGRLK